MNSHDSVPHLTTAQSGPLEHLEAHILGHQAHIESWLREQWLTNPPPFYASVDLRNAGFKLAPVDTNLFPAGFNNLNPAFIPLCVQAIQAAIERANLCAKRILIIPENHTRNLYYLESVARLQDIIQKSGYEVRVGSLSPDVSTAQPIELPSGNHLLLEPVQRHNDYVGVAGFAPCLVLLNNDLSSGTPPLLKEIKQRVMPLLQLGWATRLKSVHFHHYRQVAREFAQHLEIDPWLVDPLFRNCGEINFMKKEGESCLIDNVEALLANIRQKYAEYEVPHRPFVIVKADAGSYGMGIMTVHSGDEIRDLNRKQRVKMSATKGQSVCKVIMQEGVYTFETWEQAQAVAEPVVYMIDKFVVGGFYRVHTERGVNENLNAPGMKFEPLAFADSCITPDLNMAPDACPNRFYAYGVIARLALLAAARECQEILDKKPIVEPVATVD